jgi:hypothetical protein
MRSVGRSKRWGKRQRMRARPSFAALSLQRAGSPGTPTLRRSWSTGLSGRKTEGGLDLGGGAARDAEQLAARGGAGEERDARFGEAEGIGEEGDECRVGAAVDGRGGESDLERGGSSNSGGVRAGDRVAPGSGMDADGQGAAVRGGVEAGGQGGFGMRRGWFHGAKVTGAGARACRRWRCRCGCRCCPPRWRR